MSIYLSKDTAFQKMIDQKISQKSVFVDVFNNLVKGLRSTGVTVGDQS
jgi:hypothetical protein